MTLKDKFLTASRIDDFLNNEEVIAATNASIADKYAIGFANWLVSTCYCEDDQHWLLVAPEGDIRKSSKELLEIYKIEKGL